VATFGTLKQLGAVMYTQWLFPFEAVSLLLLVAIVGAVVVAKSRI
jgi:NADH-quinone oxidoreductase subunit J